LEVGTCDEETYTELGCENVNDHEEVAGVTGASLLVLGQEAVAAEER
jgi:hypothetical protein